MALQLRNENTENTLAETTESAAAVAESEEESKFRGGYGDGKISADMINDLPAYTAPPVMNSGGAGVGGKASRNRSVIYRIIAVVFAVAAVFGFIKIAQHFTSSGGKDITEYLTKSEETISSGLVISFKDNPDRVSAIPRYTNREITVKSGNELHLVFIKGKQVGINTDSRKYRFFGVGINDAEQTAVKNMTYEYDDKFMVLNDMLGGNSNTEFFYNKKNKDCFALTMSDRTNRVVNMTYYTDYKKMLETLSLSSD